MRRQASTQETRLLTLAQRTKTSRVAWSRTVRILPTRFPPIALFERIADPADWDALAEVESLTNERIRDQIGEISLVADSERVSGPGASWIMAAFTHIGRPSRFGNGSYGIYYSARSEECAVAETCFHWAQFLAATNEPSMDLDMRTLVARLDATLHDVRSQNGKVSSSRRYADIYRINDYSLSQHFGELLREGGSNGIVYDSVRLAGGQCAALFRPKALKSMPSGERILRYHWDGGKFDRIFDFQQERWRPAPAV